MRDVAALAGVSVKTVSNVLSGYEHVSDKMRARVTDAVSELGYEVNVSARNLRVGSTRVLGLAVPELSQAYFAELADAIIRAAGTRGYTVLIEQTLVDRSLEITTVSDMRRHSIDGLIYSPLAIRSGDVDQLDVDFPIVVLGEKVEGSRSDHVAMSNVEAMKVATLHVLSLGRRRVAVIGTQPEGPVGTAASRLRGYVEALAEHGIEVDSDLIVSAALWHRENGVEAMERLISSAVPFDAVVCFNDALALGAMRALHRNGLRIPDDVVVVGFDDIEDSAYSTPSLTTVSPHRDEIAQNAIDILIERIEGGGARPDPRRVETGYSLIVRESSTGVSVGQS